MDESSKRSKNIMPREFNRTQRLADQIQKELAQLIQFDIKDPRLGMVTLNAVTVSKDLSYANIYFTVMKFDSDAGEGQQTTTDASKEAEAILNSAAGYLRAELGKLIRVRFIPTLRFHYDTSIERGRRLSTLIDQATAKDRRSDTDK